MRNLITALAIGVVVVAAACGDTVVNVPPTAPAQPVTPTPAKVNTIEFRVTGNALSARIRYSDPVDGVAQVVSSLPFVLDVATAQAEAFLSLDVTPASFPLFGSPFVAAEIFVNNALFRQAIGTDTSGATLSVNGTWRAN